jgi:hypothetical protein
LKNLEDRTQQQEDAMRVMEKIIKENAHIQEQNEAVARSQRERGARAGEVYTIDADTLKSWMPEIYEKLYPSHQSGSLYTQEGPAYLHAGEMVIPQNLASLIRSGGNALGGTSTYNIDISIDGEGGDPQRIALAVRREMERIIRQSASMQQA